MHLNGENCQNVICREKFMEKANGLKNYDSEKKNGPQGQVCPYPRAMYMYISIIFKDLLL